MPYASGLSGQCGAVAEVTYGTPPTTTHFYEFLSETFTFTPNWLDGEGLKAGQAFQPGSRTVQSRIDVNGDLRMEHPTGEAANDAAHTERGVRSYARGA